MATVLQTCEFKFRNTNFKDATNPKKSGVVHRLKRLRTKPGVQELFPPIKKGRIWASDASTDLGKSFAWAFRANYTNLY